ncbi:biotin-dependent carboxyltransferase family protein [Halomonas sp. McH1-25]|uniref:5-oxoprolinase subunit C family protein n=1 Tax=unclassified Halomonas TaxID=2609666 RepID=UPI001EF6433E|nr:MULTISPECIES: biotin-dependent carboxyltransferase family protein [unclassified Halomonas]MCG7600589.1 biotin-dependent carboxyltransferase family protein [Halomonas sp. McH1-25]MCP1343212.1 biotin-dependent carboxyltransferase family protein [Halomonas sp. FL8]MCP1359908.1 biotin-dependent carboxyltransferase family protein [Halomonas sp. BBD45]
MSGLIVERTGPLALIEDGGRFGVRHLGVTQGGALDWVSLGWANWQLGNSPMAAALEIAVGGLVLRAESRATLALAGADLGATLDGKPLPAGGSFTIEPGQRLAFTQPAKGLRAYLAMPGGVQAEPVLGSLSSVVREGLGGLDGQGRALATGDRIAWSDEASVPRQLPDDLRLPPEGSSELALVVGAQIAHFTGASLYAAFNSEWQVDTRADRMGVRLRGPELHCQLGSMVSEGIPLGAVQVPADGQPIILLNDRQTVGGYPRLGALTPLACARLAQCAPGESLHLVAVTPGQARQAYLEQWQRWQ